MGCNKKCQKCKTVKSVVDFSKNKSKKDGLTDWCKVCSKEYSEEYRRKNKDKLAIKGKKWRVENREIIAIKDKMRRKRDAKKIAVRRKKYRVDNAEKIAFRSKEKYEKWKREHKLSKPRPVRFPGIKFCTRCKEEKTPEDFHNNKNTKDGKCSICAECNKAHVRAWNLIHTPEVRVPVRFPGIKFCTRCKKEKPEKDFAKGNKKGGALKSWCRSCLAEDMRVRRAKDTRPKVKYSPQMEGSKRCPGCSVVKSILDFGLNSCTKNGRSSSCSACNRKVSNEYSRNNREKAKRRVKEWQANNTAYVAARQRRKYAEDLDYRLRVSLRNNTSRVLKGKQKAGSFVRDLGCSIKFLEGYLESQFYLHPKMGTEMTWDNWGRYKGKWQIHHIIPLSLFDLTIREQFLIACHYTNLQPLWYEDHIAVHAGDFKTFPPLPCSMLFSTPYNQPQSYAFY